jgi:hypothetical protein
MATFFKVGAHKYPLPDFETITFAEGRFVKKCIDLTINELPAAYERGDPDAFLALFIVAKLRVDGKFDPDDLDGLQITALGVEDDEPEEPERPLEPGNDAKPAPTRKRTATGSPTT